MAVPPQLSVGTLLFHCSPSQSLIFLIVPLPIHISEHPFLTATILDIVIIDLFTQGYSYLEKICYKKEKYTTLKNLKINVKKIL